jgi:hypothetical protein
LLLMSRPHRLEYALGLVAPEKGVGERYERAVRMVMQKFGIGRTAASEDISRAYEEVAWRVNRMLPTLPGRIRAALERLAHTCEASGNPTDRATASITLFRLGKLSGMSEASDETLAGRLSDAALDAAIRSELAVRVQRMSCEELEELLARKRTEGAPK